MANRERGSVLALMPVAVLVFLVLGAIAVDFVVVFLGEREVANAAAAAANDVATVAVDRDRFYADGAVRLEPSVAEAVAAQSVAAAGLDHLDDVTSDVSVSFDGPVVTVTVAARVPYIFAKAVPGGPQDAPVSATAVATAEEE